MGWPQGSWRLRRGEGSLGAPFRCLCSTDPDGGSRGPWRLQPALHSEPCILWSQEPLLCSGVAPPSYPGTGTPCAGVGTPLRARVLSGREGVERTVTPGAKAASLRVSSPKPLWEPPWELPVGTPQGDPPCGTTSPCGNLLWELPEAWCSYGTPAPWPTPCPQPSDRWAPQNTGMEVPTPPGEDVGRDHHPWVCGLGRSCLTRLAEAAGQAGRR